MKQLKEQILKDIAKVEDLYTLSVILEQALDRVDAQIEKEEKESIEIPY